MAFFAGALMALKLAVEEASKQPPAVARQKIVELINEAKSVSILWMKERRGGIER